MVLVIDYQNKLCSSCCTEKLMEVNVEKMQIVNMFYIIKIKILCVSNE